MKRNVGGIDRLLRIVIGAIMVVLAALGTLPWWGYLGVVLVLTGFLRFCGLYTLLGINTCKLDKSTGQ